MKYKLKIVPENGGYVGYALLNDEVVYTTNTHKDTIMASRELTTYVSTASQQLANPTPEQRPANTPAPVQHSPQPNLVPTRRANSVLQAPSAPIQGFARPSTAPVRRCCGRG